MRAKYHRMASIQVGRNRNYASDAESEEAGLNRDDDHQAGATVMSCRKSASLVRRHSFGLNLGPALAHLININVCLSEWLIVTRKLRRHEKVHAP